MYVPLICRAHVLLVTDTGMVSYRFLILFPDPTLCEGKGSGDIGNVFLVLHGPIQGYANSHVIPIQTYVNDHMIAELSEPRIGTNVPRPFPHVCGGGWE